MTKKVVCITSCITGIAHTYMAAEALKKAGAEKGFDVHVETQGATGAEDVLTPEQIAQADGVVFAIDKAVDESRFAGKYAVTLSPSEVLKNPGAALEDAVGHKGGAVVAGAANAAAVAETAGKGKKLSGAQAVFQHVMNGVSHMLPIVVAGGILTALRYAFGSVQTPEGIVWAFETPGTLPFYISEIGATFGLGMMIPVLAAFIASSVADRPGFVPGLVGGLVANSIGSGFIGGILAGLIAGYLTYYLNKALKLPPAFAGLKPILILPLVVTAATGLIMYYVVGAPVAALTAAITQFLNGLTGAGSVVMGIACGLLYFDLGGPVSKVLYAFAIGCLDTGVYGPMAAVMLCGMVPPLALGLATIVRKHLWTEEERNSGKAALLLGCSYITEGAIPFATSYPLQVIPGCMAGGAVAATMSLLMGVECTAPHGGMFLLFIPNVINNIGAFLLCLGCGMVVGAAVITALMALRARKNAGVEAADKDNFSNNAVLSA